MSWEITLLYSFSWNFICFGQKKLIKVQNLRLLTAQVKSHKICTLIGSFYWKYIKFQLKKYRGVIYISWYWRVMQNLKKNRFVVLKMTRIWWILIRALKNPKNLHFDWSFPVMFDLKKCRGVIFHDTTEWCKIWRKNNFWFGK